MAALPSTPDQPRTFTGKDILAHGSTTERSRQELKVNTGLLMGEDADLTTAFKDAFTIAGELQKARTENDNGYSVLEAARSKRRGSFTEADATAMYIRFGAGRAEFDSSGAKVEINKKGLSAGEFAAAEANLDNAHDRIDEVLDVIAVVSVVSDVKSGMTEADAIRKAGIDASSYSDVRKEVIDRLAATPAIQALVPEIAAISDPVKREKVIEERLASDPALAAKLVDRMRTLSQRTQSLKDVATDPELQAALLVGSSAEATIKQSADDVTARLKDSGLAIADEGKMVSEIEDKLTRGMGPEQILEGIKQEQYASDPDLEVVRKYRKAKDDRDAAQAVMDRQNEKTNRLSYERAKTALDAAELAVTTHEGYITGLTDRAAKEQKYDKIERATSMQQVEGGYSNIAAQALLEGVQANRQRRQASEVIKQKGATAGSKESLSRSQRLREEADIVAELDDVISESVIDLFQDRHTEMNRLENLRLTKRAEDLAEHGEKDQAEALKTLTKAMQERWISFDKNGKNVDRSQIGADMRVIAYEGEAGVKKLMRVDLLAAGVTIEGTAITTATKLTPEQETKLNELCDKLYASEGAAYTKRLLGDYATSLTLKESFFGKFLTKKIKFNGSLRELDLQDHEVELLNRNFGGMLDTILESSPEAKAAVDEMTRQGIKLSPKVAMTLKILAALGLLFPGAAIAGAAAVGGLVGGIGLAGATKIGAAGLIAKGLNDRKKSP